MPSDKVTQNGKQLVITSRAKTFLCRRLKQKPKNPMGKMGKVFPIQMRAHQPQGVGGKTA